MTDFIHEQPQNKPAPPPEKPTTPKERQRKVYVYVAILFTAAFILILWSFFMTHRSNQQMIDKINGSTTYLQSTLAENEQLEQENKVLSEENDALQARVDALERQIENTERDAQQQESEQQRKADALTQQALHLSYLAEALSCHDAGDDESALVWLKRISPAHLPMYSEEGEPSPVSAYLTLYRELTSEN